MCQGRARMRDEMGSPHGVVEMEPLYPAQSGRPDDEHGSGTEAVAGIVSDNAYPLHFRLKHGRALGKAFVQVLTQFVAADHSDLGVLLEIVQTLPEALRALEQRVHKKVAPPEILHVQTVDDAAVAPALRVQLEHVVVGGEVGLLDHLDEGPHVIAYVVDCNEPRIRSQLEELSPGGVVNPGRSHDKIPVAAVDVRQLAYEIAHLVGVIYMENYKKPLHTLFI